MKKILLTIVACGVVLVSLPFAIFAFTDVSVEGNNTSINTVNENIVEAKAIQLNMERAVGGLYATTQKPLWDFILPVNDGTRTSGFGPRNGKQHQGLDIVKNPGALIYAVQDGVVIRALDYAAYGNFVEIDHGNGVITRYAHLSSYPVSAGDRVSQGDVIGAMGNTGNSSGPHLHFEVLIDGVPTDPAHYLPIG